MLHKATIYLKPNPDPDLNLELNRRLAKPFPQMKWWPSTKRKFIFIAYSLEYEYESVY